MWKPRRLTTLWAFVACYRDSFTFIPPAPKSAKCPSHAPTNILHVACSLRNNRMCFTPSLFRHLKEEFNEWIRPARPPFLHIITRTNRHTCPSETPNVPFAGLRVNTHRRRWSSNEGRKVKCWGRWCLTQFLKSKLHDCNITITWENTWAYFQFPSTDIMHI
jgi:hypothetical protein